jgi:hypothetical protein
LAPGRRGLPQAVHTRSSAVPHLSQNFDPAGDSWLQLGHATVWRVAA